MIDPQKLTGPERDEHEARQLVADDLFHGQYGDELQRFPLSGRGAKDTPGSARSADASAHSSVNMDTEPGDFETQPERTNNGH